MMCLITIQCTHTHTHEHTLKSCFETNLFDERVIYCDNKKVHKINHNFILGIPEIHKFSDVGI